MERKTDLENVKRIAKGLLNIPVLETEYSPMIVSHPFTKCGIIILPYDDDYYQMDITKSQRDFDRWKKLVAERIDDCQNVDEVYYLLNDSYQLMFFDAISTYLSTKDYASLLGRVWTGSEYANEDANVSTDEMIAHFQNADKKELMSSSEMKTYNGLDDVIVVYRGVSVEKNNVNALSWTTSFAKAKWFAERWGDGVVYSAFANKSDVFAYFDRRNEDEVIVDFNKLQNIKTVKCPQSAPQREVKVMQ